jgi:hypothetical protein
MIAFAPEDHVDEADPPREPATSSARNRMTSQAISSTARFQFIGLRLQEISTRKAA